MATFSKCVKNAVALLVLKECMSAHLVEFHKSSFRSNSDTASFVNALISLSLCVKRTKTFCGLSSANDCPACQTGSLMVTGRVSASVAVSSKQFQLDGGQLHHDRLSVLNKSARCLAQIVASAVKRFLSFWLLLSRQPCSPTARRAQQPVN